VSKLSELNLPGGMSSSRNNLMKDFYTPCLARAVRFDRAAGYFSSAIFSLAPLAYSDFFLRGGRIRLVSSTQLSPQDAEAIDSEDSFHPDQLVAAFQQLEGSQSRSLVVLAKIFSTLLHSGVLELKFAEPSSRRGVFHDKYGIFHDEAGGAVSFIGSTNETAFAWSGLHNHEQIEIFRSSNSADEKRIADHVESFERIWSNDIPGFSVFSSENFESAFLRLVPPEPLEELVTELRLREFEESESSIAPNPTLYTLREYQSEALATWEKNGRKGVISFATGGGKTLTAIEGIRRWLENGPALILVPSTLLLEQWREEIRSWLPHINLLQVGAGVLKSKWSRDLFRFSQDGKFGPRVILSTYASATTHEFRAALDNGSHIMVVADEVHRFGSSDTRLLASWLNCGPRLGLSATPIRQSDEVGTQAIFDFFGEILSPVYSLGDAIRDGILVPYDYQIALAPLNQEEQEQWDFLSQRISREIAINNGKLSELAKRLSIKRARISKRAKSKAQIASQIIRENVARNDRWLVYCESVDHLNEVKSELQSVMEKSFTIMEFHSKNKAEHKRVISFFESRGGIVLAIKCLDEGIDIPIINRAIILSSSTNPREYIQRRGRVLRRHPNKAFAQVWDLLTVDAGGLPIAQSEVIRATQFAAGSRTKSVGLELALLSDRATRVENSEFDLE
jgi:superfamily II DNA or RNA helicase